MPPRRTPGTPLSARELEVAKLAASGLRSREIAEQLVLSERTIPEHLRNIYGKLGIGGPGARARLTAWAVAEAARRAAESGTPLRTFGPLGPAELAGLGAILAMVPRRALKAPVPVSPLLGRREPGRAVTTPARPGTHGEGLCNALRIFFAIRHK